VALLVPKLPTPGTVLGRHCNHVFPCFSRHEKGMRWGRCCLPRRRECFSFFFLSFQEFFAGRPLYFTLPLLCAMLGQAGSWPDNEGSCDRRQQSSRPRAARRVASCCLAAQSWCCKEQFNTQTGRRRTSPLATSRKMSRVGWFCESNQLPGQRITMKPDLAKAQVGSFNPKICSKMLLLCFLASVLHMHREKQPPSRRSPRKFFLLLLVLLLLRSFAAAGAACQGVKWPPFHEILTKVTGVAFRSKQAV